MHENIQFLHAFIKNPLKVGSIAPSSPELADRMLDGVSPTPGSVVLELGVGTGAITKFLQEIVPDERSYLGIELDRQLVKSLNRRFPRLSIVRGNACHAVQIHRRTGFGKIGFVLSCLPFVSIPNDVVDRILTNIDEFMADGCMFRTFQYAHGYYMPSAIKLRDYMNSKYGRAKKSQLVVKNVPPAYTLTWQT